MITLRSLAEAVRRSLQAQALARTEEQKRLDRKRIKQQELDAWWREERARREAYYRDDDGSRATARQERQEQNEQTQIEDMAAMIRRRQAKLS